MIPKASRAGRLVVITGTGTEIGKTHVAEALLLALGRRGVRAAGIKPVESGVREDRRTDAERLRSASSFHVKHVGVALTAPLSPHLAARMAGITLDVPLLAAKVRAARDEADLLVAELPGGLFTPLTDHALNADFALQLAADVVLMVGPDRLGVLHDAQAAVRAATAMNLRVDGVILVAPATPDPSTETNAAELRRFLAAPIVMVPRGSPSVLAHSPAIEAMAHAILP